MIGQNLYLRLICSFEYANTLHNKALQVWIFAFKEQGESFRNSTTKEEDRMVFSEAELVFLALIFIFTLVFLLLGKRNNISTAKNQKKKRKGSKRATRQRHCQDHQHKTRRGPDENDDDEPYNPRGTILR